MNDELSAIVMQRGSDWLPVYPCAVSPASASQLAEMLGGTFEITADTRIDTEAEAQGVPHEE